MELTVFKRYTPRIRFCRFIRMIQATTHQLCPDKQQPIHKDSGGDRGVYPNDGRLSVASKRRESLRPNRHSGVPERYARIMICPETSARRDVPVADMRWFTFSITSTKASLRLYLMSFLRYDIAPVACIVIFDESSLYKRKSTTHTTSEKDGGGVPQHVPILLILL